MSHIRKKSTIIATIGDPKGKYRENWTKVTYDVIMAQFSPNSKTQSSQRFKNYYKPHAR